MTIVDVGGLLRWVCGDDIFIIIIIIIIIIISKLWWVSCGCRNGWWVAMIGLVVLIEVVDLGLLGLCLCCG